MAIAADYVLTIPNTKAKTYDLMGWMIILINQTAFGILSFYTTSAMERNTALAGLFLPVVFFLMEFFFKKPQQKPSFIRISLFYFALNWLILMKYYLPGLIVLFLAVFYVISKRDLLVIVTRSSIKYPSLPVKNISWNELSNILLKDGLLTIDFKNNTLIQQLIEERSNINEEEFNNYCQEQLAVRGKQ